ncbi:general transcription factor IIIC subunit l(2)37Cd [Rhipicephalus microplus]|uniref:general transcription factor IIIC subunit l(2)37Cd n=1 Tax=Rhipicephalus microplus TaxID=6941 RepID=UPI0018876CFB|nr:general transcription factor 3C polypeptide 5-like [Rhipicephalus microplus]
MTALTFKDRKLVLVEYPAIVKNTDRMMKSLGGIEEISKTYADPTRRLEMKFRPEDPYCKSAYGNNTDVSCLVLKVKKNRGNADEPYTVTIEGTISTAYKFRGMVDFQYLPMRRKADGTGYESLLDQLIPPPMSSTDWLMKDAPVFILPQVFSRLDTMSIQALRDEPKRRELASGTPFRPRNAMIGRTRDRRVKFACFLNFDEEDVPTEPNPEAWKQLEWRPPDVNIKQRVQALFQQRPLWTRSALQVELNVQPVRFKLILPVVAYYVVNGPFRTAWVRLGFDPRKDPSTKIYQILDFRLKTSPCAMMLNEVSTKRGSSAYLVPTKVLGSNARPIHAQTDYLQGHCKDTTAKSSTKFDSQLLVSYLPGKLPPYRQMFYHLKDICMASVQKLVHANDGREAATCHERDGWCEEGTMNKCRQLMMAELKATVDKIRSEQPSTSREESPVALEEDDEFDDFSDDEGDED